MKTFLKEKPILLNILIFPLIIIILPTLCFADASKIFKENNKAVVIIITYDCEGNPIMQGSGFIVRPDGAIVTNYHVISDSEDIKVKAGDKVFNFEGFLHLDIENDIVILKVEAKELPTVKIGDVEKTEVGDKVYVISSPQGLENTISDGILSGIREIDIDTKIFQITAPISEGSSGSPVFNENGEVIGIATLLIEDAQNLNFAIPVNLIEDKMSETKITALKDVEAGNYKDTAEYWFLLGYSLSTKGLYTDAIDALKQAIKIKPNYADAYNDLGTYYVELGIYSEALKALKQAIKIQPDLALVHYNLGVTYGYLGMHKEAIEAYKQAIRINPGDVDAYNNLGLIYQELDMHKEAKDSFKQAIIINADNATPYYNLGRLFLSLDMYREAGESFKQVIRIQPDNADAHFSLGVVYFLLNDKGSVLEEYKILKVLDPKLANELFNLNIPKGENWEFVSVSEEGNILVFVDKKSIQNVSKNVLRAWLKIEHKDPIISDTKRVSRNLMYQEWNCIERSLKYLQISNYYTDGTNDTINVENDSDTKRYVIPGTIEDEIFKYLCINGK